MARLFLQMGSNLSMRGHAAKAVLLASAIGLNLIFIYYTTDLTAKMTCAPSMLDIRSFQDIMDLGYKVRASANRAEFGRESVVCPVCYATNTKANHDPKYQTWISIHKSRLIFLGQSFVACKTNRTNNTFAASRPLV